MISINDIRKPIIKDLEAFDTFIADNFSAEGELLQEMLTYALSSRGKGIRPILTLLIASLHSPIAAREGDFSGETQHCTKRTYLAAMLVEMIHTASLIHDDVLDSADERRGKPSVNAKWQSNMAIILGDYILARTMSLGMASAQYDLISYIGTAMATLCEGEVLQSQHAEKYDTTRDDYFDIIYRKTASLLGVSAALGALSVGANREEVERMRKFGEAIGIAFQIQDDILDYKRDNNTGKPANNDLREHKITLPLIAVMERATEEQKAAIIELLRRCSDDDKALDKLHNLVVENGGLEEASDVLKSYIARAMHLLHKYDDTPYRQSLLDLCTFIAERDR
ncbi:MAG: polyprenyl synthetase family protein [Alistipes sp.]|jgi:octaprenyl-diphosphate synthase|nr:polyprenyl synthetase family protein [Alistipes sp.]MBO5855180.1 polyprenyl synthetase family protein [Alistipes sp.]